MVTTRPPKTIVKPTALGPVANTDTKLLIYGLFQQGRVLAQDGLDRRSVETASGTRFDIRSRLGGHLHGDDPPAQDDCKAHGPWPGRKHRH